MEIMTGSPQAIDYLTWIVVLLAGGAWGWILAGCWRDYLKDLKKQDENNQKG